MADDAKQVRLRLRKHNAALSPNFAAFDARSGGGDPRAAVAFVPLCGQHGVAARRLRASLRPMRTIDSANRQQKILPPRRLNAAQRRGAKPEGDLEGWKKEVAVPCGCSDLAITILSAAFAAPLVKIAGSALLRAKYSRAGEDRQERDHNRRVHCRRGRPRRGTAELGGDVGRRRRTLSPLLRPAHADQ